MVAGHNEIGGILQRHGGPVQESSVADAMAAAAQLPRQAAKP